MDKTVRELMIEKFVAVREDERVYRVVEKIAEDKETMLACIVDQWGRLKGIITPREILKTVEVREFGATRYPFFVGPEVLHILTSRYAKDIMSPPVMVKPEDAVEKAIEIMLDRGFYEVPVVNEREEVIGEINYFGIITSSVEYLKKDR